MQTFHDQLHKFEEIIIKYYIPRTLTMLHFQKDRVIGDWILWVNAEHT